MNSIPNELSSRFSNIEVRRQIIQQYGDNPNMFVGENADGEKVVLSVSRKNGIVLNTYQDNGWLRVDYYDAEGYFEGETFDGRRAGRPIFLKKRCEILKKSTDIAPNR